MASPSSTRHIVLPVSLRDDINLAFQKSIADIIEATFSAVRGYSTNGHFLCIHTDSPPPKPWPLTIGGIPLCFVPKEGPFQENRLPVGRLSHSIRIRLAPEIKGQGRVDWKPLFEVIRGYFNSVNIPITKVFKLDNALLIVLKHRATDMEKVPHVAGGIVCMYRFSDEIPHPPVLARRMFDSTPGHPNESQYPILQPGVRLASGKHPHSGDFWSTTSGILIKDGNGEEFMTASSHGFPADYGTQVFHSLHNGRNIGDIVHKIEYTDVSLVRLNPGEHFHNRTFASEFGPVGKELTRLMPYDELELHTVVQMNTPDTGYIEGTYEWRGFERIADDDPELPEQAWIGMTWFWMGNENAQLPAGSCGAPIASLTGEVFGFFWYQPIAGAGLGYCCAISAQELINRGYSLVDTRGRV